MFRSIAFMGAVALAAPAAAEPASLWNGQATAYVWGAGVGGDVTPFSGAPTVSFDRSLSEVLKDSDEFLFLTGFARRDSLVLFADLSYSTSSRSGLVPPGVPASGKLSQRSVTLAAGRRVVSEQTHTFDVMAGLRAWRVDSEVSVPLAGVSVSPSKSFADPIVAVRTNISLAPRWSMIGYADVGGFGAGSDLTYQVVVTANWQATENLFLSAGYRQLYLDYDSGGTAFNVTMAGPVLGATWRF